MKNFSFWAKTHPVKARWLIMGANVILAIIAILIGFELWLNDFPFSPLVHDIATTLFLIVAIAYPLKRATHVLWRHSYRRQKTFDFLALCSGLIAIASLVSMNLEQSSLPFSEGYALQTALEKPAQAKSALSTVRENMSWHALKKNARALKKELKAARKMAKNDDTDNALRVLYTFLILLLAIVLAFGIIVWACNLSCSGQEGAANVLLIGGGALLILLTILGIRAVWRTRKKKEASILDEEKEG